ncbi:MAG: 8-amino-7-oxononanoate synthase [Gammaproteobacteria bacterium]
MASIIRQRAAAALAALDAAHLRRRRDVRDGAQGATIAHGSRRLRNFTSNDYLGLAADPHILACVRDALPREGFGSGAAALLSGRSSVHAELERALAQLTGHEDALLFSSGYLANTGCLPALIARDDFTVHDRLNHASLIDGVLASGARHRRYPHGDVAAARRALDARGDAQAVLVTESVFSMDGDVAPLDELAGLAAGAGALLYVDDAHGFGVLGADGFAGARARAGGGDAAPADQLVMVTFGKALGSAGAAVLGNATLIDYLVQRARTYVYDTALPAVCAAATLAALELLVADPAPRRRLHANIARFRAAAAAHDLPLAPSATPIQPLMLGDDERALAIAARLYAAGFYVRAIRPPTVPRGTARLRIVITAAHDAADLDALASALADALAATNQQAGAAAMVRHD